MAGLYDFTVLNRATIVYTKGRLYGNYEVAMSMHYHSHMMWV